jgi:hypothetical protein
MSGPFTLPMLSRGIRLHIRDAVDRNEALNSQRRKGVRPHVCRHWLDEETLVVVVDAPSDEWRWFDHQFRETPRYGADVEALPQGDRSPIQRGGLDVRRDK